MRWEPTRGMGGETACFMSKCKAVDLASGYRTGGYIYT